MGRQIAMRRWCIWLWIALVAVHAADSGHARFDADYAELSDTGLLLGEAAGVQVVRRNANSKLSALNKALGKTSKKEAKKAKKLKKKARKAKKQLKKAEKLRQKARASLRKQGKPIPKTLAKGGLKRTARKIKRRTKRIKKRVKKMKKARVSMMNARATKMPKQVKPLKSICPAKRCVETKKTCYGPASLSSVGFKGCISQKKASACATGCRGVVLRFEVTPAPTFANNDVQAACLIAHNKLASKWYIKATEGPTKRNQKTRAAKKPKKKLASLNKKPASSKKSKKKKLVPLTFPTLSVVSEPLKVSAMLGDKGPKVTAKKKGVSKKAAGKKAQIKKGTTKKPTKSTSKKAAKKKKKRKKASKKAAKKKKKRKNASKKAAKKKKKRK